MWQNNLLNRRIHEELPKDFSLCDLDACVHCFYPGGVRFIIYECKRKNERLSPSQLRALKLLKNSIDWIKFDNHSGVFIIRELTENFNTLVVEDLDGHELINTDLNYLHYWFSCKDKKEVRE
jgi:hypothetical protein